ncbi:MAG TPA: isoprenylcysteine carboxylmethyltransferase family protein [Vicinamibacterales bacterium]|nr:isoprenylcysteine carboxylmethyltransferase family protein [Vicinamibacterales bacterium]
MESRVAYTALVVAVGVERLLELLISARNERRARARGAVEAGRGHYPAMVALHASFLAACPLEVWALHRPWRPALGVPMVAVLLAAGATRYWVIHALRGRWTTRVLYVPGDPLVTAGPYRWLRHPNYVAIVAEMAALPLVHGAWLTAAVFSAANALVLRRRIAAEERLIADSEILGGVAEVARAHLGWHGTLAPDRPLADVLALDSLRQLTLIVEVENRFRIRLDEEDERGIETVADLVATIRRKRGSAPPDAR